MCSPSRGIPGFASRIPPRQSFHSAGTRANRQLPTFLSIRKGGQSFYHASPRQDLTSAGEMKSGDYCLLALHRIEQFYGLSRGRDVDINTQRPYAAFRFLRYYHHSRVSRPDDKDLGFRVERIGQISDLKTVPLLPPPRRVHPAGINDDIRGIHFTINDQAAE